MPFPYDEYPWLNFQELNLAYFINHFREIFQQWDELLNDMIAWKDATDADLAEWKTTVESGISSWESGLLQSMEDWKDQTEADISTWEAATLAALDAWKTATTAVFEQIRTDAAASATAAAGSASSAQTALAGAQAAQAAAEAAASSVSASAAQIALNADDVQDMQSVLGMEPIILDNTNHGYSIRPTTQTLPSPSYNASYDCTVINVQPGQVFSIRALGGTNYNPYAFVDAEDNIIGKAARSDGITVTEEIVIAPAGADRLVVNSQHSYTGKSYYGRLITLYAEKWVGIFEKFETLSDIRWIDASLHYAEYINAAGEIKQNQPSYRRSYPIAVGEGDEIILSCRGYSNSVAILSTCDLDGNNIAPIIVSEDDLVHTFTWTAPSDGYIMISFYAPDSGYYTLFIAGPTSSRANYAAIQDINQALSDISQDVSALQSSMNSVLEHRLSDIVAVNPDFYDNALQAKFFRNYNPSEYNQRTPLLGLLHFSDLHGSTGHPLTVDNFHRILEFRERYANIIDDTICTGDMVWNDWSNSFAFWTDDARANTVLTCIGNHDVADYGNYGAYGADVTMAEAYAKYMAPNIANWGAAHTGSNTYYYKDYPVNKIRLIVLDYLLTGQNLTDETNWLISTLASAVTAGYSVICAIHRMADDIVYLNCDFTSLSGYDSTQYTGGIPERFLDAVDDYITAIGNNGYFLAWIAGHTHLDYIGYSEAHPKQLNVVVCATRPTSHFDDCDRRTGTRFQDAFNYITFDGEAGFVKIARIGANRDYLMRPRNTICIDIKGNMPTVISEG